MHTIPKNGSHLRTAEDSDTRGENCGVLLANALDSATNWMFDDAADFLEQAAASIRSGARPTVGKMDIKPGLGLWSVYREGR